MALRADAQAQGRGMLAAAQSPDGVVLEMPRRVFRPYRKTFPLKGNGNQ
jgi:hypothetical protein